MTQKALTKAKGTYKGLSDEGKGRHGCRQKVFSDRYSRNFIFSFIYGLGKAPGGAKGSSKMGLQEVC